MEEHLYEDRSFSQSQIDQMIRRNSDSKCYDNFLSQEEFEQLRSMCLAIKDWPEHGKVSKYKGFTEAESVGKIIKRILNDRMQEWIGDHTIDFYAWQESIIPWKIHSDIRWHNTKIPYKMVLFPLDVELENSSESLETEWNSTWTIVFDQRSYLEGSKNTGIKKVGNDQKDWARVYDQEGIHHLKEGYHITREEHEKYMSHFPYSHLEGLSINSIFKWKPRAANYWDNNQMHCSNNFLNNGIRTKRCLMACTSQ